MRRPNKSLLSIAFLVSLFLFACGGSDSSEEKNESQHRSESQATHNEQQAEKEHDENHGEGHEGSSENHEEHEESGAKSKYVQADEKRGVRLDPVILKQFAIETARLKPLSKRNFQVPISSLVSFEQSTGVYILRNGWYNLLPVRILKKSNRRAIIQGRILPGDRVVIRGAGMLRLIHLEAFGASGEGHGH